MDSAETRIAALLHRRLVESEKALMHQCITAAIARNSQVGQLT
jgi:hypothetical protein